MLTIQQIEAANPPAGNRFGLTKALYSANDVLQILNISRSGLYKLIGRGELRPVRVGKRKLSFTQPELTRFLNTLQ